MNAFKLHMEVQNLIQINRLFLVILDQIRNRLVNLIMRYTQFGILGPELPYPVFVVLVSVGSISQQLVQPLHERYCQWRRNVINNIPHAHKVISNFNNIIHFGRLKRRADPICTINFLHLLTG